MAFFANCKWPWFHVRGTTTSLMKLRNTQGGFEIKLDMCRFGLKTSQGDPALEPTLLLTNIEALVAPLSKRCQGQHVKRGPLLSGEAAGASRYTPIWMQSCVDLSNTCARGQKQIDHKKTVGVSSGSGQISPNTTSGPVRTCWSTRLSN